MDDVDIDQKVDSQVFLRTLSSNIGDEWQFLGVHLGFRKDQIERLKQDYTNTEDRIFNMLLDWKQQQNRDTDLNALLVDALESCGRSDLASYFNERQPKTKSLEDVFLATLSAQIGAEWETVATHLGCRCDEIDRLKQDFPKADNRIFNMLTSWRAKQSPGVDLRLKLAEALNKSGRRDISDNIKDVGFQYTNRNLSREPMGSKSINLEGCQKELQTFYEHEMGKVQLLPWGDDVVNMDTIFVNVELEVNGNLFSKGKGKTFKCVEDILFLKSGNNQRVNRVLLKGFAGSGKTTAIAKIAYDWAKNIGSQGGEVPAENNLSRFKLLFILSLRELEISETLTDAIFDQILPQDTTISKQDLEGVIQSHGKETLLLLDGMDEYPMERLQKKVTGDIESLLANKKMRDSCVVVTTRPQKIEDLGEHQKHYTQVKLNGFSEDNVEVYVQRFFKDNQWMAKDMIKVLQKSPSIKVLAQIPVMLLMLCLLWDDEQKLPDTNTSLYEQAILYLWKRCQNSHDSGNVVERYKDIEEVLLSLGKIALHGLTSDGKLVFSETDFPAKILTEACKAGLLTKERLRSKLNVSNAVSFLHKSFQEYCAAYYWVTLAEKDDDSFQSYLLHIANDDKVFSQVELLRFCCGMNEKAAVLVLSHVVQVLKHRTEECLQIGGISQKAQKDIWPLFMMLRESGLKYETVRTWLEPLFQSRVVDIRPNPPSSLGYFHHFVRIIAMSMTSSVLSEVRDLKLCSGSGSLRVIVDTLDQVSLVESLTLNWETEMAEPQPTDTQVEELSKRIRKLTHLRDISFLAKRKFDITRFISCLSEGSKGISLCRIELGNVDFDPEIMGLSLRKQTSLENLFLTNVVLTPEGASRMLSQLRSSLRVFSIVSSTIADAICHLKPVMSSLEEIILRDAKLQENHMLVLADLLPKAKRLKHLDISWNKVGSSMGKLARKLQHCPLIRKLVILQCQPSHSGVLELIDTLQHIPELMTIMVTVSGPSQSSLENPDNGCQILEAFFRSIHYLPNLEVVNFQGLPILDEQTVSPFFKACLSAFGIDLPALVRLKTEMGLRTFSFHYQPSMGDGLSNLRAAIDQFNERSRSNSGTPV